MPPMIFEAFLVIVTTIQGPAGLTRDLTRKYPMPNIEICRAYVQDPSQIEDDFENTLTIKETRFACIPRNPGRKDGKDPAPV